MSANFNTEKDTIVRLEDDVKETCPVSAADEVVDVAESAAATDFEQQPRPLARSLGSRHVTMISIGTHVPFFHVKLLFLTNCTTGGIIGAGLFVGSSAAISATGPGIIMSYFFAGVVILLVMRMLSEMALAHPDVGSFTEFSRIAFGGVGGFVCGWLYWFFWVVVVAIEAIAGATILNGWLPVVEIWQFSLGLMVVLTIVNLLSARTYGEFEFWFSSIKVTAICLFILIALCAVVGLSPQPAFGIANLYTHDGFLPFGFVSVLSGMTTVIFALVGAEIVTVAAAESSESANTVSRLTLSIIVRVMLFYVVSIALIVCVVPWNEIRPGVSPFATALDRIGIPYTATIMNVIVLTAVLSALNSAVFVTSRVLFKLASHGDAPQFLVTLNARRVPARAILLGSSFGYVVVVTSVVSPTVVFKWLVNATGAIMAIVYLVTALAQIKLRRQLERAANADRQLKVKMWLFPWSSYGVVLTLAIVMLSMLFTPDLRSELLASVGCVFVVVAVYFAKRRLAAHRRARSGLRSNNNSSDNSNDCNKSAELVG